MKLLTGCIVVVCFPLGLNALTAAEGGKTPSQPKDFTSATEQAERDMHSEAVIEYFNKISKSLEDQLPTAMKKCANVAEDRSNLELQAVLRITGDGQVDAVFTKGKTAFETCLKGTLVAVRLFAPPKNPLYLPVNLSAHH